MKSRLPVSLRFVALPAAAMLLVVGVLFAATTSLVRDEMTRVARVRVQERATLLARRLEQGMANRIVQLQLVARRAAAEGLDHAAALRPELDWLQRESPGFAWIGVVAPDGRVIAGSNGWLEGRNIAERPVFRETRGTVFVDDFHPAVALREYVAQPGQSAPSVADIGIPVFDREGRQIGVVAAHIDQRWIEALGRLTVTDKEAAQLGFAWGLRGGRQTWIGPALPFEVPPLDGPEARTFEVGHGDRMVAVYPVRLGPEARALWHSVAALEMDTAYQPFAAVRTSLALVTVLSVLGVGTVGWLLGRRLTRPYDALLDAAATRHAAEDGPQQRPFSRYLDELTRELLGDAPAGGDPQMRLMRRLARDAEQLKRLLDSLPMGVCFVAPEGTIQFASGAFHRLLGRDVDTVLGQPVETVLPESRDLPEARWSSALTVVRPEGGRRRVRMQALPLFSKEGVPDGRALVIEDVTREEQAIARLQQSEERLAAIIASASDAIISADVEGRVELFNPAAARIFGVEARHLIGRPFTDLIPPAMREGHGAQMRQFANSGVSRRPMGLGVVQGLRSDGTLLELEASISQATVRGSTVLTAILRDITERVEAERRLARTQAQLTDLAQRLLRQEKDSGERLAQSLHDELGQTLSGLRLIFEAGHPRASAVNAGDGATRWLSRLDALIADANVQVRRVLTELRPPLLGEAGLVAALDNEVRERQRDVPDVAIELSGDADRRWSADLEYAAFMIAREALANALRHARATHVSLRVQGDEKALRLHVVDDGIGVEGLHDITLPGHLGMVGMRERAAAVGARLSVESSPDRGTTVTLDWETEQ